MRPSTLPEYSLQALVSKAPLFHQTQDIDIFVEDEGSEAFYTNLLNRVVNSDVTIKRVFPLNGRLNVIEQAKIHLDPFPSLFIVDGDLYFVAGLTIEVTPNVFINQCYCIENYLFCKNSITTIILENNGKILEEELNKIFNWDTFRQNLIKALVPLFIEYATAFKLCPTLRTTKNPLSNILVNDSKSPRIDMGKVNDQINLIRNKILLNVNQSSYTSTKKLIEGRIKLIDDPLDIVSGKDYLIPLATFEINKYCSCKISKNSLKYRLASHCSLRKLEPLKYRIKETVNKNKNIRNNNKIKDGINNETL